MRIMSSFAFAAALLVAPALAQQTGADHEQHHAPGASGSTAPAPSTAPSGSGMPGGAGMMQMMMGNMPEQCRAAMKAMPASCMSMMDKMMRGGMMQRGAAAPGAGAPGSGSAGHAEHGGASAAAGGAVSAAPHVAAFGEAIEKMHAPMLDGVRADNPDVAFARGMIPHHQAAIDMALVVLKYGKDERMRKLALDVIREQNREIAEMTEWLRVWAK